MDRPPPRGATVLWEAVGRSGIPAWCVLRSKSAKIHLVSVEVLDQEMASELFTDRPTAVQHSTLLLATFVKNGWTITRWARS